MAFPGIIADQAVCVSLTDMAVTFVGTSAMAIVCADQDAVGSVSEVVNDVRMVVGFEISAITEGIDNAEISFDTHGSRIRVEKPAEIVDRAASAKCTGHENSLLIHIFGGNAVIFDVVRCSIHDGEPGVVHTHPGFTEEGIGGIEEGDISESLLIGGDILDFIVDGRSVSVLPEDRATVRVGISCDDGRSASKDRGREKSRRGQNDG